ncbi:helix-turn-helix domain-containing protein [Lysobacter antibioticus]|uniref:helix-turn-helix domain-containing protein n=1 Tax=Lysobacter antibioticus TaxID=84531 RepID=UPI00068C30AE|nr:helix-turn-helix transcriptional regulator [Lysobacter antibioticus]
MPNITSVLKDEIVRLTRKEFRQQVESLRKQVLAQRKTITSLKGDIDKLQRGIKVLSKGPRKNGQAVGDPTAPTTRARFSASGLRKLREKFGLSREAFAPLLGASHQSIYSWERGGTRPRPVVIEKIAILRGMTKRQVLTVLEQHAPKSPKPKPARAAKKTAKKIAKKIAKKTAPRAKPDRNSVSPGKADKAD